MRYVINIALFLALGFTVYRCIDPIAADHLLDSVLSSARPFLIG